MTRPHDLLRLRRLPDASALPGWVTTALASTPWVVVRRATAPPGHVAVGVRGWTRAQRWALVIPVDDVAEVRTPESLAVREPPATDVPALAALRRVRSVDLGVPWGPTGSVGFTLATGTVVVTPASDLDLLLRPAVVDVGRLRTLHEALGDRVDAQVETRVGAIALAELVSGAPSVLARTPHGPELVAAPT